MSFLLVADVFEPVFQRLTSEIDKLSELTPDKIGPNKGLEQKRLWFDRDIVRPTLKERGRARGFEVDRHPSRIDLRLWHADWEVLLELKAENCFRVNYALGIDADRSGWSMKYEELPNLAGCLFLACASDETDARTRLGELVEKARVRNIALAQQRALPTHDRHRWILGLLVTPYGRTLVARED